MGFSPDHADDWADGDTYRGKVRAKARDVILPFAPSLEAGVASAYALTLL